MTQPRPAVGWRAACLAAAVVFCGVMPSAQAASRYRSRGFLMVSRAFWDNDSRLSHEFGRLRGARSPHGVLDGTSLGHRMSEVRQQDMRAYFPYSSSFRQLR